LQTALAELHFFFSSRRRHTRWPRDWSSDVCSSDLSRPTPDSFPQIGRRSTAPPTAQSATNCSEAQSGFRRRERVLSVLPYSLLRSEERRVGKECRLRWWREHEEITDVARSCVSD